jgi:hypothetical protein
VLKTKVIEDSDDYGLGLAKGYTQRLNFTEGNTPSLSATLMLLVTKSIFPRITNA